MLILKKGHQPGVYVPLRALFLVYVAKTKALISFVVSAKLICVFVFAYAKCWFSHDVAQILD